MKTMKLQPINIFISADKKDEADHGSPPPVRVHSVGPSGLRSVGGPPARWSPGRHADLRRGGARERAERRGGRRVAVLITVPAAAAAVKALIQARVPSYATLVGCRACLRRPGHLSSVPKKQQCSQCHHRQQLYWKLFTLQEG